MYHWEMKGKCPNNTAVLLSIFYKLENGEKEKDSVSVILSSRNCFESVFSVIDEKNSLFSFE